MEKIIKLAEKSFSVDLSKTTENHFTNLICWKENSLSLDANDYKSCFQSPVLYFQEGEKKIPSNRAFENELYDNFLATSPLGGFGNAYSRSIQTKDHFLLFFASLESPTGKFDNEGNFIRDHRVTGAITVTKVDGGLLWGFWPDDNLFSNYNEYIKKICTILACPIYKKEDLKRGKFKLVHEEPDCNWSKTSSF
ncbi:MAG: hypothetical protein PHW82_11810 [Bacteroidales bacterium]|nr:hypothetical protein [Bacteroidales bacterium]